jgi:flagella basal body P-ring formation protein FlgA
MRCLLVFLASVAFFPVPSIAGPGHGAESLRAAARHFIAEQVAASFPQSKAQIQIGSLDPRMKLPDCPSPSFNLAPGSHLWGTGSVGVQCNASAGSSLYLSYRIQLKGPALLARRPLPSHYSPLAQDLVKTEIEYTMDPGRYPQDTENLHGATLSMPLAKGLPLTVDILRVMPIIRAGQRVSVMTDGPGFQITQEGIAQQQAGVGDQIRLKLSSGRYLQGTVQDDGTVYIKP